MKKYLLCNESKRCSICGASLQLVRKKATWYYQKLKTPVDRPTNLYHCSSCHVDHAMRGDHVDNSGWERLELPIGNPIEMRAGYSRGSTTSASKVKTYFDPKIKEHHQANKTRPKPQVKEQEIRHTGSIDLGPKKEKGIIQSHSDYRNCGNCDFHITGHCRVHFLNTNTNEVCKRFKHYHKREVSGGAFSPR